MTRVETHSATETEALGARIARSLKPPVILLLSGELGAGKTAFVRGLWQWPPCSRNRRRDGFQSTYVLQHIYRGEQTTVYHIDAYRLREGADEFEASGLAECFDDPRGIVCIEWPEKLGSFNWPREPLHIGIEHKDEQTRAVQFDFEIA